MCVGASSPETCIDLAVLVQIRRCVPTSKTITQVEYRALADVNEKPDVSGASGPARYVYIVVPSILDQAR